MSEITLIPFARSDRDWVVSQHRDHYAREEGFDDSFGVLVAQIVDAFLNQHNADDERGWIAWRDGVRLGSVFVVRLDATTAKLRLFLLVPEARGTGLGHRMLQQAMGFARTCGYEGMQLWTHESHRAAGALYARAGWHLQSETPVVSFGKPNVEQIWRMRFEN